MQGYVGGSQINVSTDYFSYFIWKHGMDPGGVSNSCSVSDEFIEISVNTDGDGLLICYTRVYTPEVRSAQSTSLWWQRFINWMGSDVEKL